MVQQERASCGRGPCFTRKSSVNLRLSVKRFDSCRHRQVLLHPGPEAVLLPDAAHDLLTDALAHEPPPGG